MADRYFTLSSNSASSTLALSLADMAVFASSMMALKVDMASLISIMGSLWSVVLRNTHSVTGAFHPFTALADGGFNRLLAFAFSRLPAGARLAGFFAGA